jgi:hypothetical protein
MKCILTSLLLTLCLVASGQELQQVLTDLTEAQDLQVSVITCGPGTDVHTIYGHTAIRVRSDEVGADISFNYGTFSSFQDDFLIKFIRGKLPYELSVADYSRFLRSYQRSGRFVVENAVLADNTTLAGMVDYLRINCLPENRSYLYDFFFDNCSTRVWDLTTEVGGSSFTPPDLLTDYTYRDLISMYQQYYPWLDFGIQLIIGSLADKPAGIGGQTFIPDFLQSHLKDSKLSGQPLLGPDIGVLPDKIDRGRASWLRPALVFSLLLALEIILGFFVKKRSLLNWYDRLWWIVLFIAGLIFSGFWLVTDHEACHANYNLLWANPLILLLASRSTMLRSITANVLLITSLVAMLGVFGYLPQVLPQQLALILSISILKLARVIKPPRNIVQAIGQHPSISATAV